MDVGKGSRILAIWSAQAGARKVYAVDATKMVEHASELVKAISVQDIFEVIEGSMEDVTLPEKVCLLIAMSIINLSILFFVINFIFWSVISF